MRIPEFDHPTRGKFYSHANEEMPGARENELSAAVREAELQGGEQVLEFGCGNGLLTSKLAASVGPAGCVHALDVSKTVLEKLRSRVMEPNVVPALFDGEHLPFQNESFDLVISLANFHHVSAKLNILREVNRVLRLRGRFILVDVSDNTPVQRYFDGPVNSFCSTGHEYPFLDRTECYELCSQADLDILRWRVMDVPWQFASPDEAMWFIHKIHDAQCTPEHCLSEAKKFLEFYQSPDGRWWLEWQLFFLSAMKVTNGQ